jgi:hypothetical protein
VRNILLLFDVSGFVLVGYRESFVLDMLLCSSLSCALNQLLYTDFVPFCAYLG